MHRLRLTAATLFAALGLVISGLAFVQETNAQSGVRIGAICSDGWQSGATGSGACSHHGGVSCWLYSDGSCR